MQYIRTNGLYHPDEGTIDGTVLVVEEGCVEAVRDDVPNNASLTDEFNGYAIPGFIDAHSHASIRPWVGDQLEQLRADPTIQAVRAVTNLRADLEAGTTTMRLMGEERSLDIRLSELEQEGDLNAPRLLPSGVHLTPTGGHGEALTATDGPDAIRNRIRENIAAGAHHVKYFATGGISSAASGIKKPQYADEEVAAIVAEAERQGIHVAAHAHGGAGVDQAIEAGVDTIEHGAMLDEHHLGALETGDHHVVGTSSILHHERGIEAGDADDEAVMAKVRTARERESETWTGLLEQDIDVALGTDSMHGHLADEVAHLVDLGSSPERALRAITTEAARAARVDDAVGSFDPGKRADAVIVSDHPAENPGTITDPQTVIKGGEMVA